MSRLTLTASWCLLAPTLTPSAQPPYTETLRPQFHFTSQRGWLNDPNGLVFFESEWHLFFQHNPKGTEWGNMTWGHAVSRDLVHWQQLADAIAPDAMGTVFSGSAAVDWKNSSGVGDGTHPPLIAMFTAAGGTNDEPKGKPFTQCLAYSTDKGRTWTRFAGNPVIPHIAAENRDPKVVWHASTNRWVLALYEDGSRYSLHASPDLKSWTKLQDLEVPGCSECPDFFPIALDGDAAKQRWVFTAADGRYLVGSFDGKTFKPEQPLQRVDFGSNFYAVQTYSDAPDGRRIQIAWMRGGQYPGMPFNQQMSFPAELTLRATPEGPRLLRAPVRELSLIHGQERHWEGLTLKPGDNPLADLRGELFDIQAELEVGDATEVGLLVRGEELVYRVKDKKLKGLGESPVELQDGKLKLRVVVDRTSIETFAQDGQVSLTGCFLPKDQGLALFSRGGTARVRSLVVHELTSAWEKLP